jgi:hypothetical protein
MAEARSLENAVCLIDCTLKFDWLLYRLDG